MMWYLTTLAIRLVGWLFGVKRWTWRRCSRRRRQTHQVIAETTWQHGQLTRLVTTVTLVFEEDESGLSFDVAR